MRVGMPSSVSASRQRAAAGVVVGGAGGDHRVRVLGEPVVDAVDQDRVDPVIDQIGDPVGKIGDPHPAFRARLRVPLL